MKRLAAAALAALLAAPGAARVLLVRTKGGWGVDEELVDLQFD